MCEPGASQASVSNLAIFDVSVDPVICNSASLIRIVLLVNVWKVSLATIVVLDEVPMLGKSKRRVPDCVEIVSTLKCALLAGF